MPKAMPGVTTQNLKTKAPHKHDPLPTVPKKVPKLSKVKTKWPKS
jgi:hypothetical protein